jgi:hypothetical protein
VGVGGGGAGGAGRRYLLGLGAVVAAALVIGSLLPREDRPGMWLGLGIAVALQGPLGWWLVRTIGTERFLVVWVIGIGTRLGLVTLHGLVVAPALGLPLAPALFALVSVLLSLLVVEVVVVSLGRRELEVP